MNKSINCIVMLRQQYNAHFAVIVYPPIKQLIMYFRQNKEKSRVKLNQLERYQKVYSSTSKNFNVNPFRHSNYFSKFKGIINNSYKKWEKPKLGQLGQKKADIETIGKVIEKNKLDGDKKKMKMHKNYMPGYKGSEKVLTIGEIPIQIQQIAQQQFKNKRKSESIQYNSIVHKKNSIKPNLDHKNIIDYRLFNIVGEVHKQEQFHDWGKFEICQTLGSGAYGLVKSAKFNGTKYAIKIYEKYKLLDIKKRRRVYMEASILKKIKPHQNIIRMYEVLEDKAQIHMLLQYVPDSLTLLQYFRNNSLRLALQQIKIIFSSIVAGVAHLHAHGIAHRDIKPENILICNSDDEDEEVIIKIIDFGFATKSKKTDLQCGTPNFMAPELFIKFEKHDPFKTDIWALGVTLFYLCESRHPFKGFDERSLSKLIKQGKYQINRTTNPNILDIIQKTLVVPPNQRIGIGELINHPFFANDL